MVREPAAWVLLVSAGHHMWRCTMLLLIRGCSGVSRIHAHWGEDSTLLRRFTLSSSIALHRWPGIRAKHRSAQTLEACGHPPRLLIQAGSAVSRTQATSHGQCMYNTSAVIRVEPVVNTPLPAMQSPFS
eukprot:770538-Rhodomonas_salina.1